MHGVLKLALFHLNFPSPHTPTHSHPHPNLPQLTHTLTLNSLVPHTTYQSLFLPLIANQPLLLWRGCCPVAVECVAASSLLLSSQNKPRNEIHKSMSLAYEPASEPLHISVECLAAATQHALTPKSRCMREMREDAGRKKEGSQAVIELAVQIDSDVTPPLPAHPATQNPGVSAQRSFSFLFSHHQILFR